MTAPQLMPDRYAEEHDGYLKRYLTTREKRVIGQKRELQGSAFLLGRAGPSA